MPDDLFASVEEMLLPMAAQEPDEFMLAAMREVDALTPSVPAMAPTIKKLVAVSLIGLFIKVNGGRYNVCTDQVILPDGTKVNGENIRWPEKLLIDNRTVKR